MAHLLASLTITKSDASSADSRVINLNGQTTTIPLTPPSTNPNSANNSPRSFNDLAARTVHDDDYVSPAYAELLKAIMNGNLSMVKQMLDCGLDVNFIYDREQNYSFLHLACLMGHSKVIKYLLDCGANANYVTADGHQAIDFIESDDLGTIAYMLSKMSSNKSK